MKKRWMTVLICVGLLCASCASVPRRPARETSAPEAAVPTGPEITPETVPETTQETVPETAPETVPETLPPEEPAARIAGGLKIYLGETDCTDTLSDDQRSTVLTFSGDQTLRIESEQPFSGLYGIWDALPGPYTVRWDGGEAAWGEEGFLHEYVRLPEAVTEAELLFQDGTDLALCDLTLFTAGEPPQTVQTWLPPWERADILVFPTHADDDVLFFGALISRYAVEEGAAVQTAFMTRHPYQPYRDHERLDGLWELGVRHYPIVGRANDYAAEDVWRAEVFHRPDEILKWQVEQLRRFRPLVAVGHDLNGEYGHAQHQLNAKYLTQAVEAAADPEAFPESAECYGVWDTPKLYLHLYGEGEILLDVNTPLSNDPLGRTPFEIAQNAYLKHVSQQQYYFQVLQDDSVMDCRKFGLYRTLVGEDSGNDLLEHTERG